MLDNELLRHHPEEVAKRLAKRGFELNVTELIKLEGQRKELQIQTQQLQNDRNIKAKEVGQAKARGEDIAPLLASVGNLGEQLKTLTTQLEAVQIQLRSTLR